MRSLNGDRKMSFAPKKKPGPKKVLIWEELSDGEKLKSLCDAIDDLNNEMTALKARFDEFEKRANAWSANVDRQINHMVRTYDAHINEANAWSKEAAEKINKIIFQLAARGIFVF